MRATPASGSRSTEEERLVALVRRLPEPVLSDERREQMRTAFLSTVREVKSGARPRAIAGSRRRLLLLTGLIFAGAAAAAWKNRENRTRPAARPLAEPAETRVTTALAVPRVTTALAVPRAERASPPIRDASRQASVRPRRVALDRRRAAGEHVPSKETELAFARGWSALRRGDFDGASAAFGAASASRDGALAEDALFWRGVALDRAGHFSEARGVLRQFLAAYPRSDRHGESSVILGWLLLRSGDTEGARAHFAAALDDPVDRVRNSARTGLIAAGRSR